MSREDGATSPRPSPAWRLAAGVCALVLVAGIVAALVLRGGNEPDSSEGGVADGPAATRAPRPAADADPRIAGVVVPDDRDPVLPLTIELRPNDDGLAAVDVYDGERNDREANVVLRRDDTSDPVLMSIHESRLTISDPANGTVTVDRDGSDVVVTTRTPDGETSTESGTLTNEELDQIEQPANDSAPALAAPVASGSARAQLAEFATHAGAGGPRERAYQQVVAAGRAVGELHVRDLTNGDGAASDDVRRLVRVRGGGYCFEPEGDPAVNGRVPLEPGDVGVGAAESIVQCHVTTNGDELEVSLLSDLRVTSVPADRLSDAERDRMFEECLARSNLPLRLVGWAGVAIGAGQTLLTPAPPTPHKVAALALLGLAGYAYDAAISALPLTPASRDLCEAEAREARVAAEGLKVLRSIEAVEAPLDVHVGGFFSDTEYDLLDASKAVRVTDPFGESQPATASTSRVTVRRGPGGAFTCEGMTSPQGLSLEVHRTDADGRRCRFVLGRGPDDEVLSSAAITIDYGCTGEVEQRVRSLDAPDRQTVAGGAILDRVESPPGGPPIATDLGGFAVHERLFLNPGPYSFATISMHTNQSLEALDLADLAAEVATVNHPQLVDLGC